jgi:hypothetical protein
MLATVGSGLTSAGFLAVPNLYTPWAADYDAQATWRDWIQFTSGGSQEHYTKWGSDSSGWFSGNDWTFRQGFQAITEQAGKIFLRITYAPSGDTHDDLGARTSCLRPPRSNGALVYELSRRTRIRTRRSGSGHRIAPGARFQVGRLAAQLLGRHRRREPVDLDGHPRPGRDLLPRRRNGDLVPDAGADDRGDPSLAGPAASSPSAAAPAARDHAGRIGLGHFCPTHVERHELGQDGCLPEQLPGRDCHQ